MEITYGWNERLQTFYCEYCRVIIDEEGRDQHTYWHRDDCSCRTKILTEEEAAKL
jgi:hypothetical protein